MPSDGKLRGWQLLPRRVAHLLIRAYQLSLSAFVGRYCRHEPSCSAYTDEAIQRHGLIFGSRLGTVRICRCHPWGTSGYDPVPENVVPLQHRFGAFFGRAHRRFVCEAEIRKAPKH
jgi:hypothetical protein